MTAPRWRARLALLLLVIGPFSLLTVAARSTSQLLTTKQERAVFAAWGAAANTVAAQTPWNRQPNLGEDLGSIAYSAGTATATSVYQLSSATYLSISRHFPQSFMVEDKVVTTQSGSSTAYWQLAVFSRLHPDQHWAATSSTLLSSAVALGKSGSGVRAVTRASQKVLVAAPQGAMSDVVQATNTEIQSGTAPALDPVPSFFSGLYQGGKSLLPEGFTYRPVASPTTYPTYLFRESSGATLILFTLQLNVTAAAPKGGYYSSYMFPNQQIATEQDHWLFSVAVTDPKKSQHTQLTIAGESYGPTRASATNLAGQALAFGPY